MGGFDYPVGSDSPVVEHIVLLAADFCGIWVTESVVVIPQSRGWDGSANRYFSTTTKHILHATHLRGFEGSSG